MNDKKEFCDSITRSIEIATRTMYDQIELLAEQFRSHLMIPLCKELNLEFLSGNGDFFFFNKKTDFRSDYDVKEHRNKKYLKLVEIFHILNIEITPHDYFGFYVSDVRKSDYK